MCSTAHPMEPDWSDLKVMLAVARARSVVGAAKMMGVDQSTVSRRLTALEDAVGAGLVIRGGRELTLTQEGHAARRGGAHREDRDGDVGATA